MSPTGPDDTTTVLPEEPSGPDQVRTEVLSGGPPPTRVLHTAPTPDQPPRPEPPRPEPPRPDLGITEVLGRPPGRSADAPVTRPSRPAGPTTGAGPAGGPAGAAGDPGAGTAFAVYLAAVGTATEELRRYLSGFLDQAGRRRDPLVSAGFLESGAVHWVLHRAVPYDVRRLPAVPVLPDAPTDPAAATLAVLDAVGADLADPRRSVRPQHALLVLLWGAGAVIGPRRFTGPVPAGQLLDLTVDCVPGTAPAGGWAPVPMARISCLLTPDGPAARGGLLAHCGRLFRGWSAFADTPPGLRLADLG